MAVAVAVLSVVTACSVDGDAVREPDLSGRLIAGSSFPYGPGTAVPAVALPGAISDVTFRPLRSANTPSDCTPAAIDTDGAEAIVGPGGPAGGTLTVLLARTTDSFDDFRARQCASFVVGGTVGTTITTRTTDDDGRIVNERDLSANGTTYAHVYELVRQEGSVRLYVQNRYGAATLSDAERAATRTLFADAAARAFGG
ncbi:hypothetical protein nbrc107696_30420 [Gordonia spumicola]|uniref:DUF5642 domain-containing protein n=1 Tax=Gordonia spumicola TaxID=589161 RepID=A0A7I9VB53_9ACTN|nr:hypothetical protein [Gordonia spumicola]GEE02596.1 hypothetical protein nbrc107696_30420 [Gordonia spumicola]